MKKKSVIIRTFCALLFMFSVLSLTMVFGVKAEAAYSSTTAIFVTDEGKVVSDAPVQGAAYAIRLISDTKVESSDKAHTYTLKAGIYYFDDKGNLADLAANKVVPMFTGVNTSAKADKALKAGTAKLANNTYSSSIALYSGALNTTAGTKYYRNGDPFTGYYWLSNKLYTVTKGVKGALYTGVATGVYYDATSKTFKSLGKGIYTKKGVKTTAVVNLRFYNNGNYNDTYTEWKKIGNKVYYFKKGKAVTGWNKLPSYGRGIKSYKYLFNKKTGVLYTNLVDYYGYKNFIKKKLYIIVNKRTHNTTFYIQSATGHPVTPALTISCATAKKKGDTPNGTFRLEKTWNKRWYVYTKTNGGPFRYYQWAVKIHGTSSLFHSSTYRRQSAASLDVGRYNKLGTSCTTHCVRHQAKYAKLIYDIATYKINVMKWRKTRVPVRIITSPNEGPFGHVNHPARVKSGTKYDPTDPAKK